MKGTGMKGKALKKKKLLIVFGILLVLLLGQWMFVQLCPAALASIVCSPEMGT